MNILISGASGLVGRALCESFSQGHHLFLLKRSSGGLPPWWDIGTKRIALGQEERIDVVIHLAGENIAAGRWGRLKKKEILESRVQGTKLLANFFARTRQRPKIFISASAVGFYGDRADAEITETSPQGSGFLAEVCLQWERATREAMQAGIRVVNVRFGMILSPHGGALATMLPPFRLGLGGIIGTGRQYMSWISIHDVTKIISFIISCESLSGPVNIVSPYPVSNAQFTRALGKQLGRPTLLPLPRFMAHLIFGEMADELLLSSIRAVPAKLLAAGYLFQEPYLESALKMIDNSR